MIASLYNQGLSQAEIARKLGVSKSCVAKRLRNLGVKQRPRGGNNRTISIEKVVNPCEKCGGERGENRRVCNNCLPSVGYYEDIYYPESIEVWQEF